MKKFKRKQKKQLAFLTFIVLVASVVAIMLLTPGFNIKEIKVGGNSVLKAEEIIRASGITKGINIFGVNLGEAKDNILNMGYVESVKIKRRLPSKIEINIVEEVGVAYIKADEGYVIITADGRCIDLSNGIKAESEENGKSVSQAPDLPLVTGMKEIKYKVGSLLKSDDEYQLEALINCLKAFSKSGYVFDMREIDMANTSSIRFYYRNKDLSVSVGEAEKLDYKMDCFGSILSQLEGELKGHIDLVHLTYREGDPPKPQLEEDTEEEE